MKRLKGLGWIALGFLAAIACYLISLQVSIERNRLADVNSAILDAKRDIRQLETEFTTRASLRQLERWNGEVLALSAPASVQFISDERQLASMDFDLRPDMAGPSPTMLALVSAATIQPAVELAAAETPAQAETPIVTAIARAVVPTAEAATRDPKPVAAPRPKAETRVAAVKPAARPAKPAAKPAKPDPVMQRMAELDTRRAQRVAMLEDRLLGEDTLGDIARTARAEARRR
ncbi:colicin transporter [Sphingomonas gilva]|uniref:Colicin transporter n=2 Tax=Sphingomonas gilva TaxID=2305907 RepID=A0A396RUG8_9SPHN|nr:colicin transporter [Sphingomonas gilva]